MECWFKNFFKSLKIGEIILIVAIVGVSIYVIVAPFFLPQFKSEILNLSYTEKQSKSLEKIIIIRKRINTFEDIIPIDCNSVIPVVYTKVISLKPLPVEQRKKKFIDIILPSILIKNFQIQKTREKLLKISKKLHSNKPLSEDEERFLENLLAKYKANSLKELLTKVNTHPPSLVIAQAAIESGWGTSRFFVLANNVFGVWTFNKNQSINIKAKNSNAYLKIYKDILQSVNDYYYSINVSWAYSKFRLVRLKTDDPLKLSNYLDKYSILRDRYVKRIKRVIKDNNLKRFDTCKLNPFFVN